MSVNLNTNTHYPSPINQNTSSKPKSSYMEHLINWLDDSAYESKVKGLAWGMMLTLTSVSGIAMLCLGAAMLPAGAGAGFMVGGGLLIITSGYLIGATIGSLAMTVDNLGTMICRKFDSLFAG